MARRLEIEGHGVYPDGPDNPTLSDLQGKIRVDSLTIFGHADYHYDLRDVLINGTIERTMDGASTVVLTVLDPDLKLLNDPVLAAYGSTAHGHKPLFYGKLLINDALRFRLVNVSCPQPRRLVLTFEAQAVADLRRNKGSMSNTRGTTTRAEFIKRMCDEVAGVKFECPELHKREPIKSAKQLKAPAKKATQRAPGFAAHAKLTSRGNVLGPGQRANASAALETAASLPAGDKATLALMEACIVEAPDFANPTGGDASSVGILQLLNMHLGGSTSTTGGRRDIPLVCNLFLTKGFTGRGGAIDIAKANPGWTAGQVAQAVQGSAFPDRYDQVAADAKAIIEKWHGGDPRATSGNPDVYTVSYVFRRGERGRPESSWDCMRRLAADVNWHLWEDDGTVYFAPGSYLRRAQPRMLVKPDAPGITQVTFDVDTSVKVSDRISIRCHAVRWQAAPGDSVDVEGYGPLDDRWLVGSIKRDKFTTTEVTVTLVRPLTPKLEPASEVRQRAATRVGQQTPRRPRPPRAPRRSRPAACPKG